MTRILEDIRKMDDGDIRQIMRDYKWTADDRVTDAARTVVRAASAEGARPLDKILLELTLNSLIFVYDKDVLVRTKHWISRAWKEIDDTFLSEMTDRIEKAIDDGVYPPTEDLDDQGQPLFGMSLVVRFKYPGDFQEAICDHLDDIPLKHTTKCHHFTAVNLALGIAGGEIDAVRSRARDKISKKINSDADLRESLTMALRTLQIRPEIRVIPDGSVVLFGSGSFLEAIHELRIKLHRDLFSIDVRVDPKRDRQPVWSYTVFSRIAEPIDRETVNVMGASPPLFPLNDPRPLLEAELGLLTFGDHKAILDPAHFDLILDGNGNTSWSDEQSSSA